ncbi:MAG: cation:dicarboxylate symporter family transporter, partial [Fluviicola sp.]
MATINHSGKKNRLTLYIFIGLFLGLGVGVLLNKTYVNYENKSLSKIEQTLQQVDHSKLKTLDLVDGKVVEGKKSKVEIKTELNEKKTKLSESRDTKLQYFTALSENIFLRLIKMIVALLVFSTLVVGVARLGDIKSVGRIGGKTLLWFLSASFVSLMLGMILVNIFQPGIHMDLP